MNKDLTRGPVMRSMLLFAVPMILGNLLQQCYNIADTLIVGQFLGKDALAAVGSSFTLMTFLISILLGLCMGSGALFSIRFGQRDEKGLREGTPGGGMGFLRADCGSGAGAECAGLCLPGRSENLSPGSGGGAAADAGVSGGDFFGIALYAWFRCPQLRGIGGNFRIRRGCLREIAGYSVLTCVQQSVMNLGILMVQGLVNGFGSTVMAAFAAAVSGLFCVGVSALVGVFAAPLMTLFVEKSETGIILEGVRYLRMEGAFYLRHRLPVPAVRPVPGTGQAGDERGADRYLSGQPGGAGLWVVGGAVHWCDRYLVVGAHRLGAGGHYGDSLLHPPQKAAAVMGTGSRCK